MMPCIAAVKIDDPIVSPETDALDFLCGQGFHCMSRIYHAVPMHHINNLVVFLLRDLSSVRVTRVLSVFFRCTTKDDEKHFGIAV